MFGFDCDDGTGGREFLAVGEPLDKPNLELQTNEDEQQPISGFAVFMLKFYVATILCVCASDKTYRASSSAKRF